MKVHHRYTLDILKKTKPDGHLPTLPAPREAAGTAPEDAEKNWFWLARIRHPQGRKGEVIAQILTIS